MYFFSPRLTITPKSSDISFEKNKDSASHAVFTSLRTAIKAHSVSLTYREKNKHCADVAIQIFESPDPNLKIASQSLYFWLHFAIRWLKPKIFAGGNLVFTQDQGISNLQGTTKIQIIRHLLKTFPSIFASELKGRIGVLALSTEIKDSKGGDVKMPFGSGGLLFTQPVMILDILPHWTNLDDYLNDLSSKYKNRVKQILKRSKNLKVENASLSVIKTQQKIFKKLLDNVLEKSKTKLATLPEDYFVRIKTLLPDHFFVQTYYQGDKVVGFISYVIEDEQLSAHLVGLDYSVVRENSLYNRILLDLVLIAIEKQVKRLHFARTAAEIKSTLGAKPHTNGIFIKTNNFFINCMLSIASYFSHPPGYIIRNPFKQSTPT